MIARHHPKNDPWGQQHQPAKTLLTGSIYSLVLIFESKFGNGKVIVTGVDLTSRMDRRPESSQLFTVYRSIWKVKILIRKRGCQPTS
ncbi:MAG: hypothetical protein MI921_24270 [Cytophagales bacterium]|nr:hypothetical protein [Cytophagales bacterium]